MESRTYQCLEFTIPPGELDEVLKDYCLRSCDDPPQVINKVTLDFQDYQDGSWEAKVILYPKEVQ